ncbi:Cyclopropane-fatty-acyl-phospholipid synthase [bacterium HR40]|nr:Cyclopropane-fatty-acyl-phospholipid synthase [bacterium HR40]
MLARRGLDRIFRYLTRKSRLLTLEVEWANGERSRYFAGAAAADVRIRFRTPRAERRSFWRFYQGLFESYIDQEVDFEGDRPIVQLARLGHDALGSRYARGPLAAVLMRNPWVTLQQVLQEWRQSNRDLARAQANAIYHYGLDPRFFEYLLGETVGYSEGYWPPGTNSLDQAKVQNYDYIARKMRLAPGLEVVEVGAGWGYMPLLMRKRYGCHVTVYNPVPRQNAYMAERFRRHGAADIRILEKDHRQLVEEPERYDRYVSIGVYEHVGYHGYASWIRSIAVCLKPGGIGVLSSTFKMVREMTEYLTLKYIFPGGHLPSLPLTLRMMDRFGLNVLDVENLWPHYQKTVACWLTNLERHWAEIQALDPDVFDERFRRIWTLYLSGTVETFESGLDLCHIVFVKGRRPEGWAPTRDFLYDPATPTPPMEFWPRGEAA